MKIVLGGKPGSGKSTIAKLLAEKLKLKHYSMGDFWEQIANERGIPLLELLEQAKKDPELDKRTDRIQIELGKKEDNFVIDSRLGFHFIPDALKIFLDANETIRAKRIFSDSGNRKDEYNPTKEEAKRNIQKREKLEKARYRNLYNLNPFDKKKFDRVINTSNMAPEQVVDKILKEINKVN